MLDNLLYQNILLRCYTQGQTAQELCDELGVARPYIEDAVNVLLRDELLTADGGRVRTNFIITSGAQEEARLAVYDAHKDELSREIVRQLMAHEQEIRAIGFIGCDVPMPRLLWWLIYRCTAALPNPAEMPPRPYHADGGAYHLMGSRASRRTGIIWRGITMARCTTMASVGSACSTSGTVRCRICSSRTSHTWGSCAHC